MKAAAILLACAVTVVLGKNINPKDASTICARAGSDSVLVAHENCNKFYKCFNGLPVTQNCPANLLYNPYELICDWPQNVECGDRVISEDDSEQPESDDGGAGGQGGDSDSDVIDEENCNCNPAEAPSICAKAGSDGVLVAHENCNKFYKCFNGSPVTQLCPGNLLYNPYRLYCDWPENVECGDRVISEDSEDGDSAGGEEGGDSDSDVIDEENCNCDPAEASSICAKFGSDGVLVAHENCNKFYKCFNGSPVPMLCPGNLLYNPYKLYCDFPENVKCGDRVISEDDSQDTEGDNPGGEEGGDSEGDIIDEENCNCDPAEAPAICAKEGSDGVLVAHENCNKFYKCFNGSPVTQFCPGNLLYNPYRLYCDWPQNVECGDRVISEDDSDASEDGGSEGGEDDGDSEDDVVIDEGNYNYDPEEAPVKCAQSQYDGSLLVNKFCNQFYQCAHGKPVTFVCPGKTLYRPATQKCEYPEVVKCGNRIINN